MAAQLLDEVVRNGQALLAPATTENRRVICRVPRETTHKRAAAGETLELFSVGGRSLTGARHHCDECLTLKNRPETVEQRCF